MKIIQLYWGESEKVSFYKKREWAYNVCIKRKGKERRSKMYKMVVTVVKEGDAELGKMKSRMQYYFEDPVDAVNFYQQVGSQSDVVYINIRATSYEEEA